MKVHARRAYNRLIVWDLSEITDFSQSPIDLYYEVKGEKIGVLKPLTANALIEGCVGDATTQTFVAYIPHRFQEEFLEISVRQTDTTELVGSTRCWCGKTDVELVSENGQPHVPTSRQHDTRSAFTFQTTTRHQAKSTALGDSAQRDSVAFFTICSKNFLAHARVLWNSLRKHYPHRKFYVVLCDQVDGYFDPNEEPFDFIYLEDLALPDLDGMAHRYNITEFNTSVKPFAFKFLFDKFGYSSVIYLDPDIIAVSRLQELDELLKSNAPAVLTPHLLKPAEHDEVHDGKMLLFGIYNLGFLALSDSPDVRLFLDWWGRRLEKQCLIDLQNGIFVDQKWADLLPSFVPGVHILHHPGYNVAYWNLPQRTIRHTDGQWLANDVPLRFVHFSGNKLEQTDVLSRHSQQVTMESIGDLRLLLNQYRESVFSEGHHRYREMPYAYNWSGNNGINLHTPEELDKSKAKVCQSQFHPAPIRQVKSHKGTIRLLYMDWGIPRPDVDAGSVTASIFLKIFCRSGIHVTFLPGSLNGEEPYASQLKSLGIRLVTSEQTTSVYDWLEKHAKEFDVFFLSRGPVCAPYIDIIKERAPSAKVIFNTVDLHYLRERREAQLTGDSAGLKNAEKTKRIELDLIIKADSTIVLSTEEVYKVREELPDAKLSVIPIVFDDVPGSLTPFSARRDIVFIGSFPHKPNIDAVLFFVKEVFSSLQKKLPGINFLIVGANPPDEITELAANSGVKVLGFVKELGDVFNRVRLSVAPLRYGAGIKGKIGTSFCYGVPCIATPVAAEGMGITDGVEVLVAQSIDELIAAVVKAYSDEGLWSRLSYNGLKFVEENYSVTAIGGQLTQLVRSLNQGWQQMEGAFQLTDWSDWERHNGRIGESGYLERQVFEQSLLPTKSVEGFRSEGYCCVCQKPTKFLTSNMYATGKTPDGRVMPNWREHLQCEHCGLVNRVRAALHCLHTYALPSSDSRLYITEQLTTTYDWLKRQYPQLVGSEYFGSSYRAGDMVGELRNENVMGLSFEDKSFDRILSLDVLEHVPDHLSAFRELYRVLDDNGVMLFSVPFSYDSPKNIVRAMNRPDGSIHHLAEPEYHGNPVDPDAGALCYQYFGWEMLDQLRACGFKHAKALAYWSKMQGYLGKEQYLFLAIK